MKTTVEIGDELLGRVKQVAAERGITLRELIERGLRRELEERSGRAPFTLADASFAGNGLRSEFAEADWERIREAAYEGRGA